MTLVVLRHTEINRFSSMTSLPVEPTADHQKAAQQTSIQSSALESRCCVGEKFAAWFLRRAAAGIFQSIWTCDAFAFSTVRAHRSQSSLCICRVPFSGGGQNCRRFDEQLFDVPAFGENGVHSARSTALGLLQATREVCGET